MNYMSLLNVWLAISLEMFVAMFLLQAIAKMKESSDKDLKVDFMKLDLASFQSTKDFVRAFKEKNLPLHILINNAAVAGVPFSEFTQHLLFLKVCVHTLCPPSIARTEDGMELQYQVTKFFYLN